MYNEHFGLTQAPFRITPDTGLFYTGGGRGDVLEALVYAVTTGEGIVKVVGEVGTGKTMLCRMLEERLPDNVQIAYLANPSLTPEDILHAVALELGLELAHDAPRLQVMHRLQQALLQRHAQNQRVVALVEEAQSMPVDTLEEIRLLSNLETKNEKLLQIILFGQPELDDNLALPEIRQLRERITHSFALKPLGGDEVKDYVAFRLRSSGYRGRDAFSRSAYRAMSRASEGLTRRVNIIADKAMLAAYAQDTHDVSARHVKVAIQDSEFGAPRRPAKTTRPLMALVGVAAVAAILAGSVGWYAGTHLERQEVGPGSAALRPDPGHTSAMAPGVAVATQVTTLEADIASSSSPVQEASATGLQTSGAEKLAGVVVTAAMAAVPRPATTAMTAEPRAAVSQPSTAAAQAQPSTTVARRELVATAAVATTEETPVRVAQVPVPPGPAIAGAAIETSATDAEQVVLAVADTVEPPTEPPVASVEAPRETPAQPMVETSAAPTSSEPAPVLFAEGGEERAASASAPASPTQPAPVVVAAAAIQPEAKKPMAPVVPAQHRAPRESGSGSLLDQQLEYTQTWLSTVDRRHFSIQLLAAEGSQLRNLERFLKRRDRDGQLDQVFVYRTRIRNRVWFGVLFGEYASFSEARQALDSLPRALTRHQPFIRNIRDISISG